MSDMGDTGERDRMRAPLEPPETLSATVPAGDMPSPNYIEGEDDVATAPVQPYQPISLIAVIGFGMSVVYAVIMATMALAALRTGVPMFWSVTTFLIPIFILGVALVGYLIVQRSEGTRAGARLAQVGMIVTAVVALLYLAYYAGVYFAVRAQASDCTSRFLQAIADDDIDQAFRLTIPPDQRPAQEKGSGLHADLEINQNMPTEETPQGNFTKFTKHRLVHILLQGGAKTEKETLAVSVPEYSKGGYTVQATYRFKTPESICMATFTLIGTEGGKSGKGRREWHISDYKLESEQLTDFGTTVDMVRKASSQRFAMIWIGKLQHRDTLGAYLDSLPAKKREELNGAMMAGFFGAFPLGLEPPPVVVTVGCGSVVPLLAMAQGESFIKFARGEFVTSDETLAQGNQNVRDATIGLTRRGLLNPRDQNPIERLRIDPGSSYRWYRTGDNDEILHIEHDVDYELQLSPPPPPGVAKQPGSSATIQGTLVLEGKASVLDEPTQDPDWRVIELRLTRARQSGGGNAPPGPGGRPPR